MCALSNRLLASGTGIQVAWNSDCNRWLFQLASGSLGEPCPSKCLPQVSAGVRVWVMSADIQVAVVIH